ncbi:MAG: 5-formyltetrahydrofolate cyclo-ligase [Kiritimatiellae bacterium]|nr:5-formyltetrahydrofolate cyclo-ligase [Kiritimatiellia bacterium]
MEKVRSKRALRSFMKALRRDVSGDRRNAYSSLVCKNILERDDVQQAVRDKGMFALYLASQEEIDLSDLVEKLWEAGCKVAVPAWREDTYKLVEYSPATKLVSGPMKIMEPAAETAGGDTEDEKDVSVWVVPGLAFTRSGGRLGYGGGWYDRFLSRADPSSLKLGVAYPFQVVQEVPVEPHDLLLTDVAFVES